MPVRDAQGQENIAVIGFTTDGDVFGGFYRVAVTKQDDFFKDPNVFIFSFESHGRCETPQRFVVKEGMSKYASVKFFKDDSDGCFVIFYGCYGFLLLGNEKSITWRDHLSNGFEGVEDTTLTGTDIRDFTCSRLVGIQLE